MASASPWLAGGILIAAGLFQFSKLKEACLSQCRSPVTYFMLEWREGNTGALRMGLKHGVHCVGCCWVLMALLFVAGVMNLLWMALITVFVLIEKVMPRGELFGRVGGVGMVIWGIGIIVMGMVK
jgi:predicted metal-binding membrane protein